MARYGYVRVSTMEQVSGTSLDEQEARIKWVCDGGRKQAIDEVFVDAGVSGSIALGERPAGSRLTEVLRAGDTLYVAKLDRLFRSASDALLMAEDFQKRGIDLVIADIGNEPVTQNGVSKMFFGMLACVAEFERSRIIERITGGKAAKRARGGYAGGKRPFGFQIVGQGKDALLVEDEAEQKALKRMKRLRAKGLSLAAIADDLSARGVKVSTMGVKKILDREGVSSPK